MSKKNKGEFTPISDLREEQKRLEKKIAKAAINCSHTNEKGKVKIDFIKGDLAKCKLCGTIFSFKMVEMDQFDKAVTVVHNALNQIKAMTDDPDTEASVIRTLGEIDFNLNEAKELYRKTVYSYGKGGGKKKKKNKNRDDFGSYGANNLSFIGGGNNRRFY